MNTQKAIDFAASYAPPVCKVINLELDGAVLESSGSTEFIGNDIEYGW